MKARRTRLCPRCGKETTWQVIGQVDKQEILVADDGITYLGNRNYVELTIRCERCKKEIATVEM